MKTLFLAIAVAVSIFACSSAATPTLDPSIPLPTETELFQTVLTHLEGIQNESGHNCLTVFDDALHAPIWWADYLGDRTWDVSARRNVTTATSTWRVHQTGEGENEVVKSPEWLKALGCG